MTNKKAPRISTVAQLKRLVRSRNTLRLVIKGHQFVESALNRTIVEALAQSHLLEVKRMQFPLKVDLVIALGLLEIEARPALLKLNGIRNRFAHEPHSRLTKAEAMQLYRVLSPRQARALNVADPATYYKNAAHVFQECLTTIFFSVTSAVSRLIDERIRSDELSRMVRERMEGWRSPEHQALLREYGQKNTNRIEERVRRAREERERLGEP